MHLEHEGQLDPDNEIDLYCLHFVFLPRINRSLTQFTEMWNRHKLRTAHNKSPIQLFISGLQDVVRENNIIAQDLFENLDAVSIEHP